MERGDKEWCSLLYSLYYSTLLQCCTILSHNFLPHSFLVVILAHLAGHHVTELGKLNLPGAVTVELVDHLQQLRLGGVHPHGPHGVAKLSGGDCPATISVKQVECLSEKDQRTGS